MTLTLDHILLGAPDLDAATTAFSALSGVTPSGGGSHPGFGTRNKLVSLGEALFFEVIAPDPEQLAKGRRADGLSDLAAPKMMAFCLRSSDLLALSERATAAGLSPQTPVPMSRTRPDGVTLNWEILYLDTEGWGDAVPFVIDWKGSPHPAETSPEGCALTDFAVLHPDAAKLRAVYEAMGIDVPVKSALAPGFLLKLDTPNGEVVLT
ncbi:VOC family protein [Rhodobacteraceae bacterium 2CG4]|uniref:VOC family protein n=1 Tax=Halovulum marinum TaxID=2662447 RepID=A0A6L5Z4F9_9RHOB|nr:VOC family protein [Halovulum marinum]MSU90922.1 VOC family protein [Halovulum marinum]